jgi:hypothetical protein
MIIYVENAVKVMGLKLQCGGNLPVLFTHYVAIARPNDHSVQNLLSSRLLSKNLKIKIYRTIILPVVSYGV